MVTQTRIELFGGLCIRQGERTITRLPTRKTASLLAYLAYYLGKEHPREVLVNLLWPDSDLNAGRKSLSVALSAIRRELEPPGIRPGSILHTDHFSVKIFVETVVTDVLEFEAALDRRKRTDDPSEAIRLLAEAAENYRGQLLPGLYEDWIPREQERLAMRLEEALTELSGLAAQSGDIPGAFKYARRLVDLDPLREEGHRQLMRLYAASGRVPEALRQFQELEQSLRRELGALPSPVTRALAAEIAGSVATAAPPVSPVSVPAVGRPGEAPPPEPPPPPLLSGSRLPSPWTLFVGRVEERSWLVEAVGPGRSRLITLTGPGGSGKSRLAVEVARELKGAYHGRVWFIPLADLADPRSVPDRLAQVLGVGIGPGEDALEKCLDSLQRGGGHALLVFDNFEHLIAEGSRLIHRILDGLPEASCLVTSRHRLNVEGEREFPVPSLATPCGATLEELRASESVQLFVDRAQAVRPGFQITAGNAEAVRALCGRLEGIPLAIELAAARSQVLAPAQMLEQLHHRFSFLVARHRDADARHRSLEAAIDWSYRLLPAELQAFFAALSIFRGGWSLDAAVYVAGSVLKPGLHEDSEPGADSALESHVLDALARLRECSLIFAEEVGGEMRYRMLETLREYGADRHDCGERGALYSRLVRWHLSYLHRHQITPSGKSQAAYMERMDRDQENFWAALDWCRSQGVEVSPALEIASRLGPYWYTRGYFRRASECLLGLLERSNPSDRGRWRAAALNASGVMLTCLGEDGRAVPLFREALGIGRETADRSIITHSLSRLAAIAFRRGDFPAARASFEEALEILRRAGDVQGVASNLASLGSIARAQGDLVEARRCYEESLAVARKNDDSRSTAMSLDCLGRVARDEGELDRARACHLEALAIREELGDMPGRVISMGNLSLVEIEQGEYVRAEHHLQEALRIARDLGDRVGVASCLWALAFSATHQARLLEARSLYQESLEIRASLGHPPEILESVEGLATVDALASRSERAATLFAGVDARSRELGVVLPANLRAGRASVVDAVRATLSPEAWIDATAAGESLPLAELVRRALSD